MIKYNTSKNNHNLVDKSSKKKLLGGYISNDIIFLYIIYRRIYIK